MNRIRALGRRLLRKIGIVPISEILHRHRVYHPAPQPKPRPANFDYKAACVYHATAGKEDALNELIQASRCLIGSLNANPLHVGDKIFAPRVAQMTCSTITPIDQSRSVWEVTLLAEIRLRGWDFHTLEPDGRTQCFQMHRAEPWPTPAPWVMIPKGGRH